MVRDNFYMLKRDQVSRVIYLIAILYIVGCKSFIQIDPPKSELVTASVFENDASANAAITAIYATMNNDLMTYRVPFHTGLYGDELQNAGSALNDAYYFNNLGATSNTPSPFWDNAYKYIYRANAVLEGIEKSLTIKEQTKIQLGGESLFIRAFWYFYLTNLYGDVPLLLTTDYEVNRQKVRTPVDQIYQQLITDLERAVLLLNEEYADASGTLGTSERVRPNKGAALALLARITLFAGNFSEAATNAGSVIETNGMYDTVALDDVFLKNSKEAIWQIPPSSTNTTYNTQEGRSFIIVAPIAVSPINETWLTIFESGDMRLEKWVGTFIDETVIPSRSLYFPYKYKNRNPSPITEYSMVLRLAEMYLIRSEARLQQNDISGARNDLNVIRKRAGLPLLQTDDKQTLLDALIHERRIELFCEWGHRWFDMKRYGIVNDIMADLTPQKGGIWKVGKDVWPIAQTELDRNRNLTQNEVYK